MASKSVSKKVHFPGVGKCKFHAEREGTCDIGGGGRAPQDAATNSAATSGGGCAYAGNTQETSRGEKHYGNMRSHHVLPLTAYKRYKTGGYKGFETTITAAYRGTSYCANQEPNMKWLPLKTTYKRQRVNLKSSVWDLNLPCHDIDHDGKDQGYTYDVIQRFKDIWDEIKNLQQKDPPECLTPDEMNFELRALETDFKTYLDTLSATRGGTRTAIQNQGDMAKFWWLPFSMATDRVARTRPFFRFGKRPK